MSRCHANRPSAEQKDGIGKVISSTAFHTFQPCSVRYAYVLRRIYIRTEHSFTFTAHVGSQSESPSAR